MPSKLGLPAMLVACLLALGAPALADSGTSTTTEPVSSPTDDAPAPEPGPAPAPGPEPEQPTEPDGLPTDAPPTTLVEEPAGSAALADALTATVNERATASGFPIRGTRVRLAPLPPPPPPSVFDPPNDGGNGRRVVYSKTKQTVWVYDANNTIIKMHRVSGRQTPLDPSPGVYRVWSRSISTYSINNPSITWSYMVRFAKGAQGGNIGFHEIPYQYGQPVQTISQLGQPLSGGCVRQAPADALWMWNWAGIGTVVIVTP